MEKSLWEKILETVKPLKNRGGLFGREIKPVRRKSNNSASDDVVESVSFLGVEDIAKPKRSRHIFESEISIGDASRIDKHLKREVDKNFVADARLDLHGKTLESGYRQFVAFVNANYDVGCRHLIVVTGKGTPSRGTGVIKRSLPTWLVHPDIADKILYVNYANVRDGGDGAVYILLRKNPNI